MTLVWPQNFISETAEYLRFFFLSGDDKKNLLKYSKTLAAISIDNNIYIYHHASMSIPYYKWQPKMSNLRKIINSSLVKIGEHNIFKLEVNH